MSRIGRLPVIIPEGVNVNVDANNLVTVTGKLGTLSQLVDKNITVTVENNQAVLTRNSEAKPVKAKHGLFRALLANMVKGVSEGFSKTLVCKAVGLKINKQGNKIVLNIGYSNPVDILEVEGITLSCTDDTITVTGSNKEQVGQIAAQIRKIKPIEPYHGYGIRYQNEVWIQKEGKKAGKK